MDELVTQAELDRLDRLVVGRIATLTATNDQLQREVDWTRATVAVVVGSTLALIALLAIVELRLRKLEA